MLRALPEYRNVLQRMKMLPGNALGVGDPVFFTPGVAAVRLALVEKHHIGIMRTTFEHCQFFQLIGLEPQIVNARYIASRRDSHMDTWVLYQPPSVARLVTDWLGGKELGIEGNVRLKVI